jgi:hypothetical protein
MKATNISILRLTVIALLLFFNCSLHSQVISGQVKTIKLAAPEKKETVEIRGFPRLQIEKQVLSDENNNNVLEANESAKLELKINNMGNNTARNVRIKLAQTDEAIKGLLYDSDIELGDLPPHESRSATLVIAADYKIPKAIAKFKLEVVEDNGFNVPPVYIDIAVRPEMGTFTVDWISPSIPDTTVFAPDIPLELKIQSGSPIKTISVFKNDIIQISDYNLRKYRNVYAFSHNLTMSEGQNTIKVKVVNEDNNEIEDIRKVYYQKEKRLALIIGNSDYIYGGSLANPVNDAKAMANVLKKVGFEVMEYENLTQPDMKKAIDEFGNKLYGYDVGLFYYAGHGIQSDGFNYLIPVEAQLMAYEDVEYDCVRADRILSKMEYASTSVNVLILDACRDNPFERKWNRAAAGKGLAFMDAPSGSLVAYATSPGRTAADGAGKNGLYTEALLKYIQQRGLQIEEVFKNVRREVETKSGGQQTPWESTSLKGYFYFKKKFE